MLKHIRPWQLFEKLAADQRDVLYHIPEMRGEESLTVFSLDTLILVAAARIAGVTSIFEIGTSWGYNAFNLARNLPSVWVTTVDIEAKPRYAWSDDKCESRIFPIILDLRHMNPFRADMLFIDGDHSYEAVKRDSEYAFHNARKVIAWHDYGDAQPGVRDYLNEISESWNLIHIEDSRMVLWFKEGL